VLCSGGVGEKSFGRVFCGGVSSSAVACSSLLSCLFVEFGFWRRLGVLWGRWSVYSMTLLFFFGGGFFCSSFKFVSFCFFSFCGGCVW